MVTGGAGFIGAALVRRLVKDGYSVRILDNFSRGAPRRLQDLADDIEIINADIRDSDSVIQAAAGVDAVVHLASVNGTEFFYSRPELCLDVSLRGILAVIAACRQHGIGDLVVASSAEVYQSPAQIPTDESAPLIVPDVLNPRYSYGGGKIALELVALNYGRTEFERVSVFRPHNVYGPDMGWEHVIPQFALRAARAVAEHPIGSVPFPIQGDGTQTRAFMHIQDCIDGLSIILDKGKHLGIYHIGNPEEITIRELAHRVIAEFGREAAIFVQDVPAGAALRRCPDIGRLQALGYQPHIDLAQGLSGTIAWYTENAALKPAY